MNDFKNELSKKILSFEHLYDVIKLKKGTDIPHPYLPTTVKKVCATVLTILNPSDIPQQLRARWLDSDVHEPFLHTNDEWFVIARECLRLGYLYDLPDEKRFCAIHTRIDGKLKFLPSFGYKAKNSTGWAYTESWEKGLRDIQTPIRPGKYLRKLKQDASDESIKQMVAALNSNKLEVKVVWDDRGEWRRVYENGPSSCMSHSVESFNLEDENIHPVEPYARKNNGVGLVYVENCLKEIGARTIITNAHEYVRIYKSDNMAHAETTLSAWLNHNDYVNNHSALEGYELDRFETYAGDIICPYIDHNNIGITPYHDRLVIDREGLYQADHSSGLLTESESTHLCYECEERYHEDQITYSEHHEENICDSCASHSYTHAIYTTSNEQTLVRDDEVIYLDGQAYLNDEWVLRHHDYYEVDGDWYHDDVLTWDNYGEEKILISAARELYDGSTTHHENTTTLHDGCFAHSEDRDLVQLHDGRYAVRIRDEVVEHPDTGQLYLYDDLQEELDLGDVA